jgi:hypothetical protein
MHPAVFGLKSFRLCDFDEKLIFQVHFVEMDPWVVSDVLRPNLEVTGFVDESVIHTVRVEKFFERAEQFVGMYIFFPFNFIL